MWLTSAGVLTIIFDRVVIIFFIINITSVNPTCPLDWLRIGQQIFPPNGPEIDW